MKLRSIFALPGFLTLLILLVGCGIEPLTEPRRPDPENEPTMVPTSIAVEKPAYIVEQGAVSSQLFKSGRVTPVNQTQLSSPLDGRVVTLLVGQGDLVAAGDVVAVLDTAGLEQELVSAESDLNLALEQLEIAQENRDTDLRRAEIATELVQLDLDLALQAAGDSPTADQLTAIEKLRLQLELTQLNLNRFNNAVDPSLANNVAQAQLQRDRIQAQITQSTLVAPTAGTIMALTAKEGDPVASGKTLAVIADLNSVELQVTILDRDLETLAEGLAASGTNPARPENTFPMTLRQLPFPYGTGAETDEADNIVRVSFDDPSQATELDIGDRIELAILLEEREDVLWLPPAAIREFNGRRFVVVQEGEAQKRLDIKIGLFNENQVEITSGVSKGQLIVGP